MQIIEEGDILVSIDVSGLYTNIPQSEGLEAVSETFRAGFEEQYFRIQQGTIY